MTKAEIYDQIERYLAGAMTTDEQSEFEARLTTEPALQAELALHQQVQDLLADDALLGIRSTLKAVNADWKVPTQQSPRRFFGMPYWASIAATLAFLVLGYWFLQSTRQANTDNLFAAHFQPYEMVLTVRGSQPTIDSNALLNAALHAYNSQNFSEAATLFESMAQANPDNIAWPFYHGVSLLASGNAARAAGIFDNIQKQESNLFQEQARWYLALSYLKSGEIESAKTILQKIETGHHHYMEAQNLLNAIGD